MTEQQPAADQLRPDAKITPSTEPGSQSSSGMSSRLDDALVEAHEREKLRRGEPSDVSEESLNAGSPIGRSPEASTGPVQD
ncbi:hypothetical protein EJV47_17550 [Hymenobacter gummosus]|uniref:Uncharacterized protein n=1 Tax=Hymenobacter gummosus TaxID=1776032 RepID=A0A431TZR3_9BACT|nr:hypothetical protein [Hymenobacter gummosus]RTQ47726.1 hypothetical protein EJV47_17550 [Hymenobacter gummosus]